MHLLPRSIMMVVRQFPRCKCWFANLYGAPKRLYKKRVCQCAVRQRLEPYTSKRVTYIVCRIQSDRLPASFSSPSASDSDIPWPIIYDYGIIELWRDFSLTSLLIWSHSKQSSIVVTAALTRITATISLLNQDILSNHLSNQYIVWVKSHRLIK